MPRRALRHVGLRVLVLVWRVTRLSLIERVILAAIASHADEDGHAFPGEILLAAETTLGLRSVRNAVRGLEGVGVLKVTRRGRQLPNEYEIQVDALESLPKVTGTTCPLTVTTEPTATAQGTDPPVVPKGDDPPGFVEFWMIYPHKVGKDAARAAWRKKRCESIVATVTGALKEQMPYLAREGGKYIPNPATWINQGRWQDEPRKNGHHDRRRVDDAWKDAGVRS